MREVVFFQLVERFSTAVTELSFPLPSGTFLFNEIIKDLVNLVFLNETVVELDLISWCDPTTRVLRLLNC